MRMKWLGQATQLVISLTPHLCAPHLYAPPHCPVQAHPAPIHTSFSVFGGGHSKMSKPFVSQVFFSSSLCSAVHRGDFSSGSEKGLWQSSATSFSVWLKRWGEAGAMGLEGVLSGGRGRGLSSSEPGLRDTRTGPGREAKGCVRAESP